MTELELLAQQVGANERTLRRAASQGTVRASRPTPRKLHITVAEQNYIRRSWPLVAKLRRALRTERNVRFALLFGSAARGDDDPSHSDVDILVELREPGFEREADLSTRLEGLLGRRVDLVLIEDAEENQALLTDAVTEGRVLVDREGRWADLSARRAAIARGSRRHDLRRRREALTGIDRFLADDG
jgi:predicted nucleotidyltransferase